MTQHLVLALQAAADTTRAYGEFPLIGARAAVWIAAEVHLMFAAFVLGVPMFAVVAEAIGIVGKDARYDRLAKEFTRLLLVAYSATAIWGAVLVFILATLWMKPWAYLTAVFAPSMWLYVALFFCESFTLYLYYYGWDRWKYGPPKRGHWGLGLLLAGTCLGREINQSDRSMGIRRMGGLLGGLWWIRASLMAVLSSPGNSSCGSGWAGFREPSGSAPTPNGCWWCSCSARSCGA